MSVVNITNIQVLDNPTRLTNPFQFEITFECIAALKNGTKIIWNIFNIVNRFRMEDCLRGIS
jgi:hypothetical protein